MNIEYNLTFNNIDYILYLSSSEINLTISLEQASETMYWSGIFDARYLEEITNKAGSFKSFSVFLKMLMSGLAKESENVLVDLLSYKDLEVMRNKKNAYNTGTNTGNNLNESNNTDLSIINKKYLIISYTNEFEKVHFPLPISFIIHPDISFTLRTIERLKKCNTKLNANLANINNINNSICISNTNRGNNISINNNSILSTPNNNSNNNNTNSNINNIINIKDLEELRNDNQNLKNKIKLLESQRKLGAVENDEFLRNYSSIKEEYDKYKDISEEKIKLLAKTVEELKLKINYNIDSAAFLDKDNIENNNNIENKAINKSERLLKTINDLELKLEKAEEIVIKERKNAQQYIDEKNREVEKIKKDIFFMRENEKKLKVKINQLEKDLEIANKKTNYAYNNIKTKSVKSVNSYKSSVQSSSIKSNYSKESNNSKASNPYDKFKGLYNKQYQPFNFFSKNKAGSKASSKAGSYAGSSKGSIYSYNSYGKSNGSLNSNKKTPGPGSSSKYSGSSSNYNVYNKNKSGVNGVGSSTPTGAGVGLYSKNKNYSKGNVTNLYKPKVNNNDNNYKANINIYNPGTNNVGLYNRNKKLNNNNNNSNNTYNKNGLNLNSKIAINNAKDNKNYLLDKQRILGEKNNNDVYNTNNTDILENKLISANNTNGINNTDKNIYNKIENNDTNPEEINARLGRIQQLLDTAKI